MGRIGREVPCTRYSYGCEEYGGIGGRFELSARCIKCHAVNGLMQIPDGHFICTVSYECESSQQKLHRYRRELIRGER